MESSTLSCVGGDVIEAFSQPTSADNVRMLRNDLLCAADSVTSAMGSLVKELNSGMKQSYFITCLLGLLF